MAANNPEKGYSVSPLAEEELQRRLDAIKAEGVEATTAISENDHQTSDEATVSEPGEVNDRYQANDELTATDMNTMPAQERIERWSDFLMPHAPEISRLAGEELVQYTKDHNGNPVGFDHDDAVKWALVESGAFASKADLEEELRQGLPFAELKRAYADASMRVRTAEKESHPEEPEAEEVIDENETIDQAKSDQQKTESVAAPAETDEVASSDDSESQSSELASDEAQTTSQEQQSGATDSQTNTEQTNDSATDNEQSSQTTPEQDKKDKLDELTAKVDVNNIFVLNFVIGLKDPSVQGDNAALAAIIRSTLETLKVLDASELNDLDDADILQIFQNANLKHGNAGVPSAALLGSALQGTGRQPIVPPVFPGTNAATPRTPITPPAFPGVVTSTGTGTRSPITPPTFPPASTTNTRSPITPPVFPGGTPGTPNNPSQSPDRSRHLDSMLTNVEADMLDRYDSVRDKWAKMSSKRQRRSIFGRFIARSRKYKEAKAEYDELSREVGRIGLKEKIDQAQTSAEKAAIATTYWIAEQNAVREKASGYTEDRRWWKAVNRVSTYMNKGSKITRIAKRATLGIVAGIAAAPIGATGLAAGLTFFATEQAKDLTGGIDKLTPEQEAELRNQSVPRVITDEEILEDRAKMFAIMYESDSKRQANKRLMKFGKNAVKGAVAGAAAYGIHEAISAGHESLFGSDSASAAPAPDAGGAGGGSVDVGSGDVGGGDTSPGADSPGYGLGDTGPQEALTQAPSGHDLLSPTDSFYVRPGEGWYETFQDMGIPNESWADVLKDAGPKLQDLGIAEFNDASGQWWIAQPGNLSTDALQTIADSSAKFGYAFKPIA